MDTADKFINNRAPKKITLLFIILMAVSLAADFFIADRCTEKIVDIQIRSILSAVSGNTRYSDIPTDESVSAGEIICQDYGLNKNTHPQVMESFKVTRRMILFPMALISCSLCIAWYAASMRNTFKMYGDLEKICSECTYIEENAGEVSGVYGKEFSCIRRVSDGISRIGKRMKYLTEKLQGEKNLMRDLLTDFSHQLKTSVSVIRLNRDMLESIQNMPEEKKKQLSDEINICFDDMEELVFETLRLAMLNADSVEYNKHHDNISYVCSKSLGKLRPIIDLKNINVIEDYDRQIDMCFDKVWMTEAVTNIIKNAADHSGCSEIKIKLEETPISAVITISDNGKGIPQSEIPHIFERFGKTNKKSGMTSIGVGMSVAEKVVRAHNGEILINSGTGTGTTFEIVLLK